MILGALIREESYYSEKTMAKRILLLSLLCLNVLVVNVIASTVMNANDEEESQKSVGFVTAVDAGAAGGAGGGAGGRYGPQRPAAPSATGFLCQKRLSPLQLAGAAVRGGAGCAYPRRAGTGFCRLSGLLSPDLWPPGAPFCAKAPIKRCRAKFSLYFGRGWCRIVADFQIQ